MFSSCFIFYDNTETLLFRLWFPTMPLLVLWLNIDLSVGAEAVLNFSSCPQTPCKIVALVWSWTAVAGVASCPRAAWRGWGEHVQLCEFMQQWSCSLSTQSEKEEEKTCTPTGATHKTAEQKHTKRDSAIYLSTCNGPEQLYELQSTSTASAGLQRRRQGVKTIQTPITMQTPCTPSVQ